MPFCDLNAWISRIIMQYKPKKLPSVENVFIDSTTTKRFMYGSQLLRWMKKWNGIFYPKSNDRLVLLILSQFQRNPTFFFKSVVVIIIHF